MVVPVGAVVVGTAESLVPVVAEPCDEVVFDESVVPPVWDRFDVPVPLFDVAVEVAAGTEAEPVGLVEAVDVDAAEAAAREVACAAR